MGRLPKLRFHSHGGSYENPPPPVEKSYKDLFQAAVTAVTQQLKRLQPLHRQIVIGTAVVIGLVVVCKTASHAHTLVQRRRRRQFLRRCEQDGELHFFMLPRSPWSPSLSPACTRVEAYLRVNGIPYKAVETIDPNGSPSGELPFLVYKGRRVDQLPRIFDFLAAEFTVTMDDALTREERAIGAALRRTLEYSMERFLYRTVFVDHPTLAVTQIARALHISQLRARLAVRGYAKQVQQRLMITAYGALISEQYENEFLRDCEALETQIGEKRFLFSDTDVTSYDCAVYALLVPFAYMGQYTALSTAYMAVAESTVLMAYIARMSKRFFSDMASQFDAADMLLETSCTSSELEEEEAEEGGSAIGSETVHSDIDVSGDERKALERETEQNSKVQSKQQQQQQQQQRSKAQVMVSGAEADASVRLPVVGGHTGRDKSPPTAVGATKTRVS